MISDRLCHSCDYNLRNLGDTGRCPECNWEFDAQSQFLLRVTRSHGVRLITAALMMCAVPCVMLFIRPVREPVQLVGAVICGTGVAFFVWGRLSRLRVFRPARILANGQGAAADCRGSGRRRHSVASFRAREMPKICRKRCHPRPAGKKAVSIRFGLSGRKLVKHGRSGGTHELAPRRF